MPLAKRGTDCHVTLDEGHGVFEQLERRALVELFIQEVIGPIGREADGTQSRLGMALRDLLPEEDVGRIGELPGRDQRQLRSVRDRVLRVVEAIPTVVPCPTNGLLQQREVEAIDLEPHGGPTFPSAWPGHSLRPAP